MPADKPRSPDSRFGSKKDDALPPSPAMQQSLKHIDLPLQLIDTPYLLSNQQVTQIIVLLFAGDGEDDGAAFRRYVEIGFAAGFRRNRGALRLTPLVRSI